MLHEISPLIKEEIRLIECEELRRILDEARGIRVSNQSAHPVSKTRSPEQANTAEPVSGPFSFQDCLFFDIETTGLSADASFVFLIGCICFSDGRWNLHQFFIYTVQEEGILLSSFLDLAREYKTWIHFNGGQFDLPFLRKRAGANQLEVSLDHLFSIDLYQTFRPLKKKLGLPRMNQLSLEKYIGWERTDRLSGKEVVSLFWQYTVSKDPQTQKLLLGHNRDDVSGMLHVLKYEAYLALFSGEILPDAAVGKSEDPTQLLIQFHTVLPLPDSFTALAQNPSGFLSVNEQDGIIRIPIYNGTLRYFIQDYKNYFYLPLEGQAIHKSIASYVEKEYRIPAKPENCFVPKSGRFLPLPDMRFSQNRKEERDSAIQNIPLFREDYQSKSCFIEYSEESFSKTESLTAYTRLLLRHFFFSGGTSGCKANFSSTASISPSDSRFFKP